MGVPAGHPFFGNQYTNGGYIQGTYEYEVINKSIDILENSSTVIMQSSTNIATKQKQGRLISKNHVVKNFNRSTLIVGGIMVVTAVGSFITYKLLRRKVNRKQDSILSVKLQHVGTCTHCGEPLIESKYIPEGEENSYNAYIICKKCGEKNYAKYSDENDSATAKSN